MVDKLLVLAVSCSLGTRLTRCGEINMAVVLGCERSDEPLYTPEEWDGVEAHLVTGDAIAAAFEAKMRADEFEGCEAAAA